MRTHRTDLFAFDTNQQVYTIPGAVVGLDRVPPRVLFADWVSSRGRPVVVAHCAGVYWVRGALLLAAKGPVCAPLRVLHFGGGGGRGRRRFGTRVGTAQDPPAHPREQGCAAVLYVLKIQLTKCYLFI
jgi:hypothetical protein